MLKHTAFLSTLVTTALIAGNAFAMDLHQARSQGLVGEKQDGFVAPVGNANGDVKALVEEVNTARRADFQSISKKNQQPLDVVGNLAAQKIIGGLEPGEYYQNTSGKWVKK